MELNNKVVGHNIALYRAAKDKKAHDIADCLGMKEATYSKYERGETAITIEFIQKVAEVLQADPLLLLSAPEGKFLKSINHSSFTFQGDSAYNTANEAQTTMMLKMMENLISVNDRIVLLLERK
jgi:transcriptional regulator with XRE-family HTH domain